jgi:4-amino-4-deoxy-L-arabinose transferase-like glycosyltransferase
VSRLRTASARAGLSPSGAAAIAVLLAGAAVLRLVGIRSGLPFPVLNPDERSIVPRAWELAQGHADPRFYDYPSLLFYLLAPTQLGQAEPSYLGARLVVAALGVGGVAAAVWLGRRAYGPAAGWVAGCAVAVATVAVAYSHMAVTDVALALGVTVALALALSGRLEWAGLAAGLAASAKYPGMFLALPLVVAGWGEWRRLARAALLAVGALVLTSPFVVVHAGAAWDDVSRVQRLARAGWLGFEDDHATPLAFLDRLWESLGPFLLLALAGLVAAGVRRTRADLVLGSFVLLYFAQLMTYEAHFERYVLPLIAPLAALAGRFRRLAPVALALLVVPLAWSVGDDAELTRTDTRAVALEWVAGELPRDGLVALDSSLPAPVGRRTLGLELPGPGRASDPRRDLARLRSRGVRYVVVNGSVADRVLAARDRYPREARFYDDLRRDATGVYRVESGDGRAGPWVAVYRL